MVFLVLLLNLLCFLCSSVLKVWSAPSRVPPSVSASRFCFCSLLLHFVSVFALFCMVFLVLLLNLLGFLCSSVLKVWSAPSRVPPSASASRFCFCSLLLHFV